MTNEDMQRAMDFIVEMKAKSSAKLDAVIESLNQSRNESDEKFKKTDQRITALLAVAEIPEREILANAQHIRSVSRDVAALSETTRAAHERLNALINAIERQISNGRNGK